MNRRYFQYFSTTVLFVLIFFHRWSNVSCEDTSGTKPPAAHQMEGGILAVRDVVKQETLDAAILQPIEMYMIHKEDDIKNLKRLGNYLKSVDQDSDENGKHNSEANPSLANIGGFGQMSDGQKSIQLITMPNFRGSSSSYERANISRRNESQISPNSSTVIPLRYHEESSSTAEDFGITDHSAERSLENKSYGSLNEYSELPTQPKGKDFRDETMGRRHEIRMFQTLSPGVGVFFIRNVEVKERNIPQDYYPTDVQESIAEAVTETTTFTSSKSHSKRRDLHPEEYFGYFQYSTLHGMQLSSVNSESTFASEDSGMSPGYGEKIPYVNADVNEEREMIMRLRRKRLDRQKPNLISRDVRSSRSKNVLLMPREMSQNEMQKYPKAASLRKLNNKRARATPKSTLKHVAENSNKDTAQDTTANTDVILYGAVITAAVLSCVVFIIIYRLLSKDSAPSQDLRLITVEKVGSTVSKTFLTDKPHQVESFPSKADLQNPHETKVPAVRSSEENEKSAFTGLKTTESEPFKIHASVQKINVKRSDSVRSISDSSCDRKWKNLLRNYPKEAVPRNARQISQIPVAKAVTKPSLGDVGKDRAIQGSCSTSFATDVIQKWTESILNESLTSLPTVRDDSSSSSSPSNDSLKLSEK